MKVMVIVGQSFFGWGVWIKRLDKVFRGRYKKALREFISKIFYPIRPPQNEAVYYSVKAQDTHASQLQ